MLSCSGPSSGQPSSGRSDPSCRITGGCPIFRCRSLAPCLTALCSRLFRSRPKTSAEPALGLAGSWCIDSPARVVLGWQELRLRRVADDPPASGGREGDRREDQIVALPGPDG